MGEGLFERFPAETATADQELGYSIQTLCFEDPDKKLNLTQFTQPALFVVNALLYKQKLETGDQPPDAAAGHSLGEINALLAAEVFDFATGLKLVKKRGEFIGEVKNGAMAAVIGLPAEEVLDILENFAFDTIDIANFNTPQQTVISGTEAEIEEVKEIFEEAGARMVIRLKVSGAFHSRHMKQAQEKFAASIKDLDFSAPRFPVIANSTARPYEVDTIKATLAGQIAQPVRWSDSVRYLLSYPDVTFEEVGIGKTLTGMLREIQNSESSR
jgi:trans-AT polyketide synthase/acyltransferase/oxidoreductase domain-containing protein